VVLPQAVPARYLDITRLVNSHSGVWVGWSGTVRSHPNDLQATGGGVAKVLNETVDTTLAYVGPHSQEHLVKQALGYRKTGMCSGWQPLRDYPTVIAEFDIGIVPLEDCTFNDAKSCLKGLELAALGVPFIASPSADYQKLFSQGAGILAKNRNDWSRALTHLLTDESHYQEVATRGRAVALERTLEAQHTAWAAAWQVEQKTRQDALQ
jgi:glycosyltransferase involved in cell wall biosynthesis